MEWLKISNTKYKNVCSLDVIYFKQLFLFFALAQKAKFGFFRINFDLYSSSLLFPFGFVFRACTFGWLSFQERDKFNYSAKSSTVGKKKEGKFFPPNVICFLPVTLLGLVKMC